MTCEVQDLRKLEAVKESAESKPRGWFRESKQAAAAGSEAEGLS
jgi:hypothetical protein